ncbi:protocatechuate 3,4-dioxygenase [Candidatus Mesenet endosymbiont of Phosphuga atrata]|uniref:protocatechuate 3,4-dioxygenase n=1 Tax=Candidatus Mesenet endosymbiont of Phosphuga atrata TaxID=3066221 RepID=UPI0030CD69B8
MKYYRLFFICFLLYGRVLFASNFAETKCTETPESYDLENKPEEFNSSNNLRRKAGSADIAKGELIYIRGKVTDINCVPVQNAVVFIWQADANGIYQNIKDASNADPNFLGSGKYITNNMGYYNFITVMPGNYQNINFLIQHPDFAELHTKMFFSDNSKSEDFIEQLAAPYTVDKNGIKTYRFNIVLGGHNKYITY